MAPLVDEDFGHDLALDIVHEEPDDVAHHGDGRLGVELTLHDMQHVVVAGVVGRHPGLLAL